MKEQISRLGFEAWADNKLVGMMETMPDGFTDFHFDTEDLQVKIVQVGDAWVGHVRAYVPGEGWKYHDRTIKAKGGRS